MSGTAGPCGSVTPSPREESFEFEGVPRFSPEHFVQVTLKDPMKRKQLKKGLQQLSEEGAVQLFFDRHRLEREPILGAVGVLQFKVIEHRLESEYKVSVQLRPLQYKYARWVEGEPFRRRRSTRAAERPASSMRRETNRPVRERLGAPGGAGDNPQLRFLAAVQPARGGAPT